MTVQQMFFSTNPRIIAEGGDITFSGEYKIHTFTSSGPFQVYSTGNNSTIEYLVVAGGGGGGAGPAGGAGGGAGGLLTGTFSANVQNYTITVGSGGATNSSGVDSTIFGIVTSTGGGRGGAVDTSDNTGSPGANGGSGGGGGVTVISKTAVFLEAGSGISGQGYPGSVSSPSGAGAGGGAGSGGGPTANGNGVGGNGVTSNISGSNVTYARGGDGGTTPGTGGSNTGNGGGFNSNGGSGIVIIRYQM